MINLPEKIEVKTTARVITETLVNLGVDSIFGYPGASVLSIYNELENTKEIKHYLVRHEQAAVHAAEGYARVSGKTGVVLVTSGPGFTNTITGIANAFADSTPLVVLVGDVANADKQGKVFQKVDIASIVKTCCKKTFTLSLDDNAEEVLESSFEIAQTGVKGPVVVILPRNILEKKVDKVRQPNCIINRNDPKNLYDDVNEFNLLLKNSTNPLILVGGGCIDSAENVRKFVDKLKVPVVSTLMGIGIFPSENNFYLGMIGLNGVKNANDALNSCDLLIALGTSFSDRSTCKKQGFEHKCKVVSININHAPNNCELKITSDVKAFLESFLFQFNNEKYNFEIELPQKEFIRSKSDDSCLQSAYVLETLSEYTRYYEPLVITDVGQHQMLTAQYFHFNKPRKFITSGGLGTMGFGLPASIGAYIADSDNLILNITGDGSFQMNLQELATCREHHIPVKIIIMNNSYLGMVRQMQEKIYNKCYQVEMTNPDFTKIAEAYDLFAIRVKTKNELIPALEKAIKYDGTAIVDIVIDSFENI